MTANPTPSWLSQQSNGVLIRIYAQPQASRSQLAGKHGEGKTTRLKIRIAAPPVDGAANDELIRFLKKLTGIPTSRIHLIRGQSAKTKDVLLEGASMETILKLL